MVTKHVGKVRIYPHYTSYKGSLFVKTLCDLFNDAAEKQTELYGVDVATLNATGMTWMLHRLHLCLTEMPVQNEEVYVETWPSGVDRLFALRDYRMFRENGEELVKATSEWMYVDLARRRPVRLPEKVVRMSTEHHIPRIELKSGLKEREFTMKSQGERRFTATFDNIDFNGHVTQASYMRWITNALPFEFLKVHRLVEVEAVYAHEIMPDKAVRSTYCTREEGDGFTILHQLKDESGSLTHCLARTSWEAVGGM